MIPFTDFHQLFTQTIIKRGQAYHASDNVLSLQHDGDGHYMAVVRGSRRYQMRVALSHPKDELCIESLTCNCEYWDNCKHMVAVLYAMKESLDDITSCLSSKERGACSVVADDFYESMGRYDKDELIDFIKSLDRKYQHVRDDWVLFCANHQGEQSHDITEQKLLITLSKQVNDILSMVDVRDYEEFVFDDASLALMQLMAQVTKPSDQVALSLIWIDKVLALFDEMMVDAEVECSLNYCFGVLAEHLFGGFDYEPSWGYRPVLYQSSGSSKLDKTLMSAQAWAQTYVRRQYEFYPNIERFYFDCLWAKGEQDGAMAYLDGLITQAQRLGHHDVDALILSKIAIYDALGKDSDALVGQYDALAKVRIHQALQMADSGNADKAMDGLKDAISSTDSHQDRQSFYICLFELAKSHRHLPYLHEAGRTLALTWCYNQHRISDEYLDEYQSCFDDKTWQDISRAWHDELYQTIQDKDDIKVRQLAHLYDRQQDIKGLSDLLRMFGDVDLLTYYIQTLSQDKDNHDWLAMVFYEHWQTVVGSLSGRKAYRDFARQVKKVTKCLPDHHGQWQQMMDEWLATYRTKPRRPALVEELLAIYG